MSAVDLQDPILDSSGIRSINFFNGRLLTARDLTREQAANREADSRLGQATGDGIAYGLEVGKSNDATNQAPLIYVTGGLAVNRRGQTLRLIGDTEVELVRQPNTATTSKPFTECLPLQSGTYVAGAGVYLLTIAPAQTNEGKAPTNGLDTASVACNTDATVTTVQFRLIQLDPPITETELDDEDHLRNVVAYKCFGSAEQRTYVQDMFGAELKTYGLLDSLRPTRLTDCDVPLAVLYWTVSGGIVFVDNWSVRRALIHHLISGRHAPYFEETSTRASAAMAFASRLAPYVDERRQSEGFAMLLQFEEQLYALVNSLANPQNFVAIEAFDLLPPAGILPLRNARYPRGFAHEKFFQNKSFAPPTPISAAKLADLLTESLRYPPINFIGTNYVQLYEVIENKEAQTSATPPQPYVVFASAELPYYSEKPRFASMCQTLRECRAAYYSLVRRDVFFSSESLAFARESAVEVATRLSLLTAIQNVVQIAGERYTAICKCGCAVDFGKAIDLFNDLYTAQVQLVETIQVVSRGLPGTSLRDFGTQLHNFLDVAIPGGRPSLRQAIVTSDLKAATEAQNVIDGLVLGVTGDPGGTTAGNLEVTFTGSLNGTQLVMGSTDAFEFVFRVANGTNRPQTIELTAAFLDPHSAWNNAATVLDMGGNPAPFVTLAPGLSDPGGAGTFQDVKISVITPTVATASDRPTLMLSATVRTPVSLGAADQVPLTVGEASVPVVTDFVRFSAESPVHTRAFDNAQVNTRMTLRYDSTFHAGAEPLSRPFRCHVLVTSTATRQFYSIGFDNRTVDPSSTANTSMDIFTLPFSLTSDVEAPVTVRLTPLSTNPDPAGPITLPGQLIFSVRLESVDNPSVMVEQGPITITTVS